MPMFDFVCTSCSHTFDTLVRRDELPACPACGVEKVEKLLSLPAIKTSGTHDRALAAAKRRNASQGKERMHAQHLYEMSHDD